VLPPRSRLGDDLTAAPGQHLGEHGTLGVIIDEHDADRFLITPTSAILGHPGRESSITGMTPP